LRAIKDFISSATFLWMRNVNTAAQIASGVIGLILAILNKTLASSRDNGSLRSFLPE
jgi:hypothetical protein